MSTDLILQDTKTKRDKPTRLDKHTHLPSWAINASSGLSRYAVRSSIKNQHGALLLKNGRPMYYGFNEIKGNFTYHAEHDVLRRYLAANGIYDWEKERCLLRGEQCKQFN
jgi:hypothetical protein